MEIKRFIAGPVSTNMYIVSDENNRAFIVDAAYPVKKLENYVEQNDLDIQFIIQTHSHFDHVLGLKYYKDLYQVDVYASEDSRDIANDPDYNLAYDYDVYVPIDRYLKDNEVFSDFEIEAIKTPGHTLDSMSYKINDIIFVGDTLFKLSVGRTDLPGGNYLQIVNSIKNKLGSLDGDYQILPGHGDYTSLKYELQNNPFIN
ncbi:MBL fold metallo-hydrolase [Anaerococcus sp. AGMB09787]|uniref:MBL fold metallo-hydrolase n=1 Tax=Anaerococcus sp. AGMB09787 TaxID=2922869 RepID=UPI001FAFDD63